MVSFFFYLLLMLLAPFGEASTDCYQVPELYGDAWISNYTSDGLCDHNPEVVFPIGNIEFDWTWE